MDASNFGAWIQVVGWWTAGLLLTVLAGVEEGTGLWTAEALLAGVEEGAGFVSARASLADEVFQPPEPLDHQPNQ